MTDILLNMFFVFSFLLLLVLELQYTCCPSVCLSLSLSHTHTHTHTLNCSSIHVCAVCIQPAAEDHKCEFCGHGKSVENTCGKLHHQQLPNKKVLAAHHKCMVGTSVVLRG